MTNSIQQKPHKKMFKIITIKNDRVNISCQYPPHFAICTSTELFELYLKGKAKYFCFSDFLLRLDV